ncbi:MAG: cytochrome c biogenesis protein ResB, partial [Candidatus Omnitrophica bacterium]|nr:cytochrome c biogenesis protein ResB [Candidatus Omnitrophota bacterium]
LTEGEGKKSVLASGYAVMVKTPDEKSHLFSLDELQKKKSLAVGTDGRFVLKADGWFDEAKPEFVIEESKDGESNAAIRLKLTSQTVGLEESFWLVEKHPYKPSAHRADMGPAEILLRRSDTRRPDTAAVDAPTLRIVDSKSGKTESLTISAETPSETRLKTLNAKIANLRYYPDARVGEGQKLISVSDEPHNPAVLFDLITPDGKKESFIKFAAYPDFESLHGKSAGSSYSVDFTAPEAGSGRPSLTFFSPSAAGESWAYEARSKKTVSGGTLEPGKTYTTGWMDFSFTVETLAERAVVGKTAVRADKRTSEGPALRVALLDQGKTAAEDWIFIGAPGHFHLSDGLILVALRQKSAPVPFTLSLRDFRKVDYPGTRSAASYESDVTLEDPAEGVMLHRTISMNKPLDYKGYRIFQSSFSQDPEVGETSIFTIAKNPGIGLIYGGAIVLFIGVALVFWVKPFSSLPRS